MTFDSLPPTSPVEGIVPQPMGGGSEADKEQDTAPMKVPDIADDISVEWRRPRPPGVTSWQPPPPGQGRLGGDPHPEPGGWWTGCKGPLSPVSREHPLPVRPSPQGPRANSPPAAPGPDPGQAARGSLGRVFTKTRPGPGLLQETLEASITMHCFRPPRGPGHRKEVPVALVLSRGTGPGGPWELHGPEKGTEKLPWVRVMGI